jgi:2-oxoglutarate ferredoxin oxidoreductase subunit alpha
VKGATIGIIAYGSSVPAVDEARAVLKKDGQLKSGFLRLRALPCGAEVHKFIQGHERVYVVEANRDGQLCQILTTLYPDQATKLRSASHTDGLPLTARWVAQAILAQEKEYHDHT